MINSCFMRCGQYICKGQTFYRTVLITWFYLLNDKMDNWTCLLQREWSRTTIFSQNIFQIIWMDRPFEKKIV